LKVVPYFPFLSIIFHTMLRMTMGSSSSNGTDYGSLTTPMGQDQIALQLGHADSNNGTLQTDFPMA
jgi:hypothetical protein